MKIPLFKKIIPISLLILTTVSCSSNLDFNQANDLVPEPVFVGNLSYFDVPATSFVAPNGMEYTKAFNAQTFDIFKDKNFRSYLQKVEFYLEINNTIRRAYGVDVILMDNNDNPLYNMHFDIPAYSGVDNVITKTEIFENAKLELLKSSSKMGFFVLMAPGPALNQNSAGNIILRSNATVYLSIKQ